MIARGSRREEERMSDPGRIGVIVALLLAAAAVALGGCGDDDEEEALSKDEYLAQGNEICERFTGEIDQIGAETLPEQGKPSARQLSRFAAEIVPVIENAMTELQQLPPPEGDEEQLDAFFAAVDDAIAKYEQAADNPSEAQRIFAADPPGEAQRIADEYGLTACGEER
jgi:hypothetical protein